MTLVIIIASAPSICLKADAAYTINGGSTSGATFILDAGHGGSDPGATNGSRRECDDNLRMCKRVGELILSAGESCAFTRISDTYVSLADRYNAEKNGSFTYFISFHRNSATSASATGVETWYYTGSSTGQALADPVNTAIANLGIYSNRGLKQSSELAVLRHTTCPAILIELGFISNDSDNRVFDNNFEAIARAIAGALLAKVGKALDNTPPTISDVRISNVSSEGYTVSCTATAPSGISSVKMPTWTVANGQDDMVWHEASRSGNTFTYNVKRSEHNNEYGSYVTHIYAYNASGASTGFNCGETVVNVSYTLDINGYVNDGYWTAPSVNYGTFDLTVGGKKVAEDKNDLCESYISGSSYSLNDIKNGSGYKYLGYYVDTSSSSAAPGYEKRNDSGTTVSGTLSSSRQIVLYYETTYTLNYDTNGGSAVSAKSAYWSESFALPSAERTGYTFAGWKIGDTTYGAGRSVSKLSSAAGGTVSAVAQWTPVVYSITYNMNGGEWEYGFTPTSSYTVASSTVVLPGANKIARTGYDFGGWYTASDLGGSAEPIIAEGSTGNKEYFAKWTLKTFTVTFGSDENGAVGTSSAVVNYGTKYGDIALPSADPNEGYHFKEWQLVSGSLGENDTVTEDIEIRAIFEKDEEVPFLRGDINNDGEIDTSDSSLILKYDAGFAELTEEQLRAGDLNSDGGVDAADANYILRYDAGLISEL